MSNQNIFIDAESLNKISTRAYSGLSPIGHVPKIAPNSFKDEICSPYIPLQTDEDLETSKKRDIIAAIQKQKTQEDFCEKLSSNPFLRFPDA